MRLCYDAVITFCILLKLLKKDWLLGWRYIQNLAPEVVIGSKILTCSSLIFYLFEAFQDQKHFVRRVDLIAVITVNHSK